MGIFFELPSLLRVSVFCYNSLQYSTANTSFPKVFLVRGRQNQSQPPGGKADWENSSRQVPRRHSFAKVMTGNFGLVQSCSPWRISNRVNKPSAFKRVFKGNQTFSDLQSQNLTCELQLFVSSCRVERCALIWCNSSCCEQNIPGGQNWNKVPFEKEKPAFRQLRYHAAFLGCCLLEVLFKLTTEVKDVCKRTCLSQQLLLK